MNTCIDMFTYQASTVKYISLSNCFVTINSKAGYSHTKNFVTGAQHEL